MLQALIGDIQSGEIKVPKFQRPFVWKAEEALQLLDSIANSYPIGSLLFWKTKEKLATDRNIGDFKLPETDELTPTQYVLDGQQRLTVIYSCFGAPVDSGGFAAGYDLSAEAFVPLPSPVPVNVFPLRYTYDTTRLLNFRTALVGQPNSEILQKRLDSLIGTITNYRIPVVTLKELSVEEVCPIFERINSSGTRLSTYDLMVAATWSKSYDLNDTANAIAKALTPKGYGDIEGNTVLKSLAAIQLGTIKREDILKLRAVGEQDLQQLTTRTENALLQTVDLLATEFGIYSWDFLPYEALVVILCRIFADHKKALEATQVTRAKQWFWRASFSQRYRGASENYISKDIDRVKKFIVSNEGDAAQFGVIPSKATLISAAFRSDNSQSRAHILLLAKHHPRNITNGAKIDVAEALSHYNKKQFHHIFPKQHLKENEIEGEHNSIVNICILAASENNKISDRDPHEYLPECLATLGAEGDNVFASNLLPSPQSIDYATVSYEDFLDARAALLVSAMTRLCQGTG